jgi:hypothetical protein
MMMKVTDKVSDKNVKVAVRVVDRVAVDKTII